MKKDTLMVMTNSTIPKAGLEIVANTGGGKAVVKTATQVYASATGLINGTDYLLSLGKYSVPFENLHLPEEYRGWYYWGTVVGKSQPLPEGIGPGISNSPSFGLSGNSKLLSVVAPIAQIKPISNAYVLANSNGSESNKPKNSEATERENLVNVDHVEDDVMIFSAKIKGEIVEGVTNFMVKDNKMYLEKLHLQGSAPGMVGRENLWKIAQDLGRQYNVGEVVIQGGKRTTGKYKGSITVNNQSKLIYGKGNIGKLERRS